MKLGARGATLAGLFVVAAMTVGALTPTPPGAAQPALTLHLDGVWMSRHGATVSVECRARWVNRGPLIAGNTCCGGEAFDGLSVVVTDAAGAELARVSHLAHQSPSSPSNPFTLAPGTTRRRLVFPIDGLPTGQTARVHLEGGVVGSARHERGFRSEVRAARIP